tara:strand:- start:4096 stop:5229 length:1134 start_codon:yes stop_codon:yes gene_type:complete
LPTDDIFDQAWNVAKEEMVSDDEEIFSHWDNDRHEDGRYQWTMMQSCPDCGSIEIYNDSGSMRTRDLCIDGYEDHNWVMLDTHPTDEYGRALPDDVEKGFFDDFARKVKQKQREQEARNAYIVNNLIRHPDGLEAGVEAHHRALEAMNRPPPPAMPESVDSVTATPPPRERESVEPSEIQPETVRAEIPRTGFRGGAEGAPTPPSPNDNSELENDHDLLRLLISQQKYEEEQEAKLRERWNRFNDNLPKDEAIPFDDFIANLENFPNFDEQKLASEPQQTADSWTVVKDPFANPFFNENFASLTEEEPPEVTHDDTPTFSLQPDLIKGDSPEDALKNAGFDARQGDDMSLLPSSAFNKGDEAPRADTSLLPAGWDSE